MRLFDDIEREDSEIKPYGEPKFNYYNRSARSGINNIREVLEEWFSHYPVKEQKDLRERFRSPDDYQHLSAFFELFLHELLLRSGYSVGIHPKLSDTNNRLDFLAQSSDCGGFYMEAVLVTGESQEEVAAQARMDEVYNTLNRMNSPDFFIGMKLRGFPATPPPGRKMRSFLEKELARLNPDEIAKLMDSGGLEALPQLPFEHEGWKIIFYPIPKSPNKRGKAGIRPMGLRFKVEWKKDPIGLIREEIEEKAKRYGNLDLPYVVAVNALCEPVEPEDTIEALFWELKTILLVPEYGSSESIIQETVRKPNGVWTSESGPRNKHLSAVLIATPVLPHNIPNANIRLYHNPWASRPITSELTSLPQGIICDDRMEWRDGKSLGSIFELPPDWPGWP